MTWSEYVEEVLSIIRDESSREGIERTVDNYERDFKDIISEYPETRDLAKEVKEIRRRSIKRNEELKRVLISRCRDLGVKIYIAKDHNEVYGYVSELIGDTKLIVKSKSMVSEEIDLRDYLVGRGLEVWETDLGEFIIQLARDIPMHIVTPAIHYKKERVAELLSGFFKKKFKGSDVEEMVRMVSKFLRDKYFDADLGIIGSNFISVEEPASILIHNEGNITMTWNTPKKLLILSDIFKLTPTIDEAIKNALVTSRYAGYRIAGYYDILLYEALVNRGLELHLILYDGGRSKIIKDDEFWTAASCIKCGACMYVCSAYQIVGGRFGGKGYPGGIGTIINSFTHGLEYSLPSLYTCMFDKRCREICPVEIDIPSMIHRLRIKYLSR